MGACCKTWREHNFRLEGVHVVILGLEGVILLSLDLEGGTLCPFCWEINNLYLHFKLSCISFLLTNVEKVVK